MRYKTPFRYNTEAIRQDIPIQDVIALYTGIDASKRGNIPCPDPEHEDRNPSAHIYKESNICKCFSCNKAFDVFDVVMANTGKSFGEACQSLIENFGLSLENYSNIAEVRREREASAPAKDTDPFPLSVSELKLLGLPVSGKIRNEEYYKLEFDEETGTFIRQGELYPIPQELQIQTLQDMWKDEESRADIEDIIMSKCDEVFTKLYEVKEWYTRLETMYNESFSQEDFKKQEALFMSFYQSDGSLFPKFFHIQPIQTVADIEKVNEGINNADMHLQILRELDSNQKDALYPYIVVCMAQCGIRDCEAALEQVHGLMKTVSHQHTERLKRQKPVQPKRTYKWQVGERA